MTERKYDLEERLINFASSCIDMAEGLPKTFSGNHLAGQLIRSSTSPCLQYGEAQSAESRSDFIHKMKVALKELRETKCCLKLIKCRNWYDVKKLDDCLNEDDQLISIFVKSLQTAEKNKGISNR